MKYLNNFIAKNPKNYEAYKTKVDILVELLRFDEALEIQTKLLLLFPNDADAYYRQGMIYFYSQKYYLALQAFNKAIHRAPKNAFYGICKGFTFSNLNKYD
jgi:tetratricopeptide (TPR) repeat protein